MRRRTSLSNGATRVEVVLRTKIVLACACGLLLAAVVVAQRKPVLQQIDLPHPYYFREMYLPQLTTGPSAAAWLPDSRTLIYSMAGSLWRQELTSSTASSKAEQLTTSEGYDYQPDCSSDGHWVVFAHY